MHFVHHLLSSAILFRLSSLFLFSISHMYVCFSLHIHLATKSVSLLLAHSIYEHFSFNRCSQRTVAFPSEQIIVFLFKWLQNSMIWTLNSNQQQQQHKEWKLCRTISKVDIKKTYTHTHILRHRSFQYISFFFNNAMSKEEKLILSFIHYLSFWTSGE